MNHGEMATHSPVSMPSAAAAWAPTPRQVAGSRYPAATPAADGTASGVPASADAPLPSGRRAGGVFMTCSFFSSFRRRMMTYASTLVTSGEGTRAAAVPGGGTGHPLARAVIGRCRVACRCLRVLLAGQALG